MRPSRPLALAAAAALPLLLLACGGGAAEATGGATPRGADGRVHLVRAVARQDSYAFHPEEVRVRPGDVVRFVLSGPRPESIAFDTLEAPAEGAGFLRESGLLHGGLLIRAGQHYDASFQGAPAGRYGFRSVPHAGHGMRGAVVVE